MSANLQVDNLVVIRIEGMHCHKCEQAIQKALKRLPGVHEVEVDFPTTQASVLFDGAQIAISELMQAVNQAGYKATGFVKNQSDQQ